MLETETGTYYPLSWFDRGDEGKEAKGLAVIRWSSSFDKNNCQTCWAKSLMPADTWMALGECRFSISASPLRSTFDLKM